MFNRKFHVFLVKILKNSFTITYFYNLYYRIRNQKAYYREQDRRSKFSIFDYKELSEDIPFFPESMIRDSNYYSHYYILRQYTGLKSIPWAIEHGIYLGNRIAIAERLRTTRRVVAMSKNRQESFRMHHIEKPILAIGPYIHYSKPYYDENAFQALKKKLGRVLVVFPSHSTVGITREYPISEFISHIKVHAKHFDSVLVCMFYIDIQRHPEYCLKYEKAGFSIVTAGHRFDNNFMPRLKTIINIADYVIANGIGTNIGYSIYMGKPLHIDYIQKEDFDCDYFRQIYDDKNAIIAMQQTEEIVNAFAFQGDYNTITDKQKAIVENYWGTTLVMTPENLKNKLLNI